LEDFEKIYVDDVLVIVDNLCRSTINETIAFRKLVEEEINSGITKLVIDLSKCDFIDSTFFGVIVIALKMMNSKDHKLKLVQPANLGEDIFTARNLTNFFDLYDTREDAVKSFV
jgi:anti-sigma B factor antagonist/stage II sporulation protein AA (anti-sigma F factor antagonist)